MKVKSLSHVWLLVTPWTAAHQAPLSMGFSRQEYWSGVPLPSPLTVAKWGHKWNKIGSHWLLLFKIEIYCYEKFLKDKLIWDLLTFPSCNSDPKAIYFSGKAVGHQSVNPRSLLRRKWPWWPKVWTRWPTLYEQDRYLLCVKPVRFRGC